MRSKPVVVVTGATGAVGSQLVQTLLRRHRFQVIALARGKGRRSAAQRVHEQLAAGSEPVPNSDLMIADMDLRSAGLGLEGAIQSRILQEADYFIHAAAQVDLAAPWSEVSSHNLTGTHNVLELLSRARRLRRFVYVSSAYAVGSGRPYLSHEDNLPPQPSFSNPYERSKYEAEQQVRAALRTGLPGTIVRPSIVVGDSRTGRAARHHVIYPLFRTFVHNLLSEWPLRESTTMNLVPVDFVVRRTLQLLTHRAAEGRCFHLVSQRPLSIGTVMNLLGRVAGIRLPKLVDPKQFDPARLPDSERLVFQGLKPFLPYFDDHLRFDCRNMLELGAPPRTGSAFLVRIGRAAIARGYAQLQIGTPS
jgi:thioester reductase-like protein